MRPRTILVSLILLALAGPLYAAPPKPTAVLQLKPIDEWLGDLKYVATKFGPLGEKLAGDPGAAKPPGDKIDLDKKLEDELAKMLGPDWRKAIDTTRPLGGYAIIKDKLEDGTFVGMVPVKDVKALLKMLANFGIMPDEKDGLLSIQLPNKGMTTIYARAANGYLYIGSSAESIAEKSLPKPDDLFGAKETSALVLRFRIDSIPEKDKKEAIEAIEQAIKQGAPAEFKAYEDLSKSMLDSMLKMYRDGREWTLGLDFDRKTGEVALAVEIIPMPGTELAKDYREAKPNLSRFAALDHGDAFFLGMTCGLPLSMGFSEDPKEVNKSVEKLQKDLAEAGIKLDKVVTEKLWKIVAAAAPSDDTDIAFVGYPGEKGKDSGLVAVHIKEGAKAEAALMDLVKELPADVRERLKLNAGKLGSVNLHRIDLGKDAPKDIQEQFGTSEVLAAITPDALYVAVGPDAEARIKAALGAKPKPAPMFVVDASVTALRKFTQETVKDEKARAEMVKNLETLTKGVDRVRLVHLTRTPGESMKYRFGVNLVTILQIANAVSSADSGTKPPKPAGKNVPKAPQPPAPPLPAKPPPEPAWKAEFRREYGLKADEVLKRVAPPFPDCRNQYCRTLKGEWDPDTTVMSYRWDGNNVELGPYGPIPDKRIGWSLINVFWFLNIPPQDIEIDQALKREFIEGEFVVRAGAPAEKTIPRLEQILRDDLHLPYRLKLTQAEREVIVVGGKYASKPRAKREANQIDLFAVEPNEDASAGGGSGTFDEFLTATGSYIGRRLVNDLAESPKARVMWFYHNSIRVLPGPDPNMDPDGVLKNITAQTGLTFTMEKRKVRVLAVTKD